MLPTAGTQERMQELVALPVSRETTNRATLPLPTFFRNGFTRVDDEGVAGFIAGLITMET